MRVIICGGRNHRSFSYAQVHWLDMLHEEWRIAEVITGGAPGAETYGDRWAGQRGIERCIFPANWGKYGNGAGPRRNERMLAYAMREGQHDVRVIAFDGGPGTMTMIAQARRKGVVVIQWRDAVAFLAREKEESNALSL